MRGACAGFSDFDRTNLRNAARLFVDGRGRTIRLVERVGLTLGKVTSLFGTSAVHLFGRNGDRKYHSLVEQALHRAFELATLGLKPEGDRKPTVWMHKVLGTVSGAAGGFIGLPGLAADLPVTTCLILRSIAEIARAYGEDVQSDEGKRACLEVFAFGGPRVEDDDLEAGYWAARAAFSHKTIEATIRGIAPRLGMVLSEKFVAQAIPIAGAAAGATLNYIFIDYYQQMARVHFILRDVERHNDREKVRACFDALVREIRARKVSSRDVREDRVVSA
jgi:hypothetical protein